VPGVRRTASGRPAFDKLGFTIEEHGRSYDYSEYCGLGMPFLKSLLAELEGYFRSVKTYLAKDVHEIVIDLLHHLCVRKAAGENPRFFKGLATPRFGTLSATDWEVEVGLWRELQRTQTSRGVLHNIQTANRRMKQLSAASKWLSKRGVLPNISIRGFRKARARASVVRRNRPTLAQLPQQKGLSSDLPEDLVGTLARYFSEPSLFAEAKEFLQVLYEQLDPASLALLTPERAAQMMYEINKTRLATLRTYMEGVFIKWYEHWKTGKIALEGCKIAPSELVRRVDSDAYTEGERREQAKKLFGADAGTDRLLSFP
jgi:hypothetical protein